MLWFALRSAMPIEGYALGDVEESMEPRVLFPDVSIFTGHRRVALQIMGACDGARVTGWVVLSSSAECS